MILQYSLHRNRQNIPQLDSTAAVFLLTLLEKIIKLFKIHLMEIKPSMV